MAVMPQSAYLCVMSWISEVPLTRFEHLMRRQLFGVATVYLQFSTAAWSPSRPAMLAVAQRALLCWYNLHMEAMNREEARFDRQWDRVLQTVIVAAPGESTTAMLRRLARLYRVSEEVTRRLLRRRPELSDVIAEIRADVEEMIVEDASSSEADEPEDAR